MPKRGIESLGQLQGKRALVRVDFNVPLREEGGRQVVADDYRLLMSLPTIKKLLERRARVVLCSHLGRPKKKGDERLSLAPIAQRLGTLLPGVKVKFHPECHGEAVERITKEDLFPGEVLLLENLRYEPGEQGNDAEFGQALSRLGDVYVNDAFGVSHRPDASVTRPPTHLPAAAGELVKLEVEKLQPLREGTAPRPYVVVLGGAKLSDKIPVLEALIPRCDAIFVGGGMAYTFLKAMGKQIGKSRVDTDLEAKALEILELARERSRETGRELLLPRDHVVATSPDDLTGYAVVDTIPDGLMALDIGPQTIADYAKRLRDVQTVFWNGPLGVFEKKPFHLGTGYVASVLAHTKSIHCVVGGGDSAAATRELGLESQMEWVSTGGGASLEYVQGEQLPGIEALPDA